MSTTTVHHLMQGPITCHCWNGDRTKFAISPNNAEVHIYSKKAVKWEVESVLSAHTSYVTGMDWAPQSGLLVTCSADRDAYVWKFTDGAWKKARVILHMNSVATVVKWSPQENKFAVGSGAGIISICYHEKDIDWWMNKHIFKKSISSTITSLEWHPNNYLLAVGFSNFKLKVFSAYVNDIEPQPRETAWAKKMVFGRIIAFSNSKGGRVHSVTFSPSGNKLCWVGDSSISVANMTSRQVKVVKHSFLPYVTCQFMTENIIVAAGHDSTPMVWVHNELNVLTYIDKLEKEKTGGHMNAIAKFQRQKSMGPLHARSPWIPFIRVLSLRYLSMPVREEKSPSSVQVAWTGVW